MSADRVDSHPPTLTLLMAAATLALGMTALASGGGGWAGALALERTGSSWLQVAAHPFVHLGPAALVVNLIVLLAAGHVVEARVGSVRFAGLVVACAAASAGAWRVAGDAPTWSGAAGPALGLLAAALVVSPRLAVSVPVPRATARLRTELLVGLGLGATALVLGGDLPWWLLVVAYGALLVAGLHDHVGAAVAAGNGDTAYALGARMVAAPAWLIAPLLLLAYVALGALGLLGGVAPLVAGALTGAAASMALACAGQVTGTHELPTLAEVVGVRPLPTRQGWRRGGRLAWDPTLPGPD